jgi:hypothetical protein
MKVRYKDNEYLIKNKDLEGIVHKYLIQNFFLKRNMLYINYLHDRQRIFFPALLKYFTRFFYRSK